MINKSGLNRCPFRRKVNRRGVALLIVLASIVLLTLLVVAFLSNVGTELKSSKVYANGSSVKLLAQSTVNLVQAVINDATHDGTLCWVSQPGMIRTFDNTGMNSGTHTRYYKLYSDDTMVGSGLFSSTTSAPPADWYSRQGVYVDLNQPVTINGTRRYPIVDGDSNDLLDYTPSASIGATKALKPLSTVTSLPQVAGFWIKGAPLQPSTVNQAPMPVKWLYVLRDGSMVTPDSNLTGGATTFNNTPVSLRPDNVQRQIVGRMAFWTDDESCKVNVNTAAEGACLDSNSKLTSAVWDTPRFRTSDYDSLTLKQPVQNEFQRYAGHPSTVSLSAVFGNIIDDAANPSGLTFPENIFALTPRITQGGSKHGTISLTTLTTPLSLRTDRLYDTVDEFMFQNNRSLNSALLSGSSVLDQATIEKAKFFLTASSHAPDVNLFNQPRISMWPVSAVGTTLPSRSPKDQLIAFCSTVGGFGYYFQRQYPNVSYVDSNNVASDLPGVTSTDGTATGLGHNRQLLEYLRYLTSQQIPGFGGSLAGKYNSGDTVSGSSVVSGTKEIDQILTEVFDYIRCTNLTDQSLATSAGNPVTMYAPTILPAAVYPNVNVGAGQALPIMDMSNGTRGFGRFPTLQQIALIFYASKDDGKNPPSASQIKCLIVPQLFDPAMGYPISAPYYLIKISGLTSFLWDRSDSTSQMYTTDSFTLPGPGTEPMNLMQTCGGVVGWRRFVHGATESSTIWKPLFSSGYPNNPSNLSLTSAGPAGLGLTGIHFRGGSLTVEIFQKKVDGTVGSLLQSIKFTIPDAPSVDGFPVPGLAALPPPNPTQGWSLPSHQISWESWDARWQSAESKEGNPGEIISKNDVIRSVVANPGDMRLIAARKIIDDSTANKFLQAHPRYSVVGENMAHNLSLSNGNAEYHASMTLAKTGGRLVNGALYSLFSATGYTLNSGAEYGGPGWASYCSDVPTDSGVFVGGTGAVLGDWDNGVPSIKDGAYINKPDEGDTFTSSDRPYFENGYGAKASGQTFFSPNRMIPSPGMLGSLPTGVLANKPWQTLLFRPGPFNHPGLGSPVNTPVGPPYTTPPDSLMLDFFTMPVVEPYAISEPLATAGRVNMNYQIVPFTYLTRNTAILAALRGAQVIAVPNADVSIYKYDSGSVGSPAPAQSTPYRISADAIKTLTQFDARFNNNDVFRSPAEICSIDLVPSNYTGSIASPGSPTWRTNLDAYWVAHRLTGDNTRERPYTNLYPLLTTRSNTFTVHFRVQTLKKVVSPITNYAQWVESTDLTTGEYRGSQTIERYVDANNATDSNGAALPNFADPANYTKTLAPYYKFRSVATRQFAP